MGYKNNDEVRITLENQCEKLKREKLGWCYKEVFDVRKQ